MTERLLLIGDLVKVKPINRFGIIQQITSTSNSFKDDEYTLNFGSIENENSKYGIYTKNSLEYIGSPVSITKEQYPLGNYIEYILIDYPNNKSLDNHIGKTFCINSYTDNEYNEGCSKWAEIEVYKDGYEAEADNTWTLPITAITVYRPIESDIKNESNATDTSTHYAHNIQPIEYIQQVLKDLPVSGFEGACIKDIIKYCSRYGLKDDKQIEAKKILDYALWLYMDSQSMTINPRTDNHEQIYNALFKPKEQPV